MKTLQNLKHILRGAAIVAAMAPAAAFAGNRVGVLECDTSGSPIGILVENQLLDCVYEDDDEGARPVHYIGKLTKVGANISVNGPGDFLWVVGAATSRLGPGALSGEYAGPGASVKVGVGPAGLFSSAGLTTPFPCSLSASRAAKDLASRLAFPAWRWSMCQSRHDTACGTSIRRSISKAHRGAAKSMIRSVGKS